MTTLVVFNETVFNDVDVSTNATSALYDIRSITGFCVHSFWSGVGGTVTISMEASNDIRSFRGETNNWAPIDIYNLISTPTNNRILNVEKANYCFLRFTITQTGGSGNFSAILVAKR